MLLEAQVCSQMLFFFFFFIPQPPANFFYFIPTFLVLSDLL